MIGQPVSRLWSSLQHNRLQALLHRSIFTIVIVLLATNCATQPAPTLFADRQKLWLSHLPRLTALNEWSLEGRTAIKTASDKVSAAIAWHTNNEESQMHLSGPFGQRAITLHVTANGAELTSSDGQTLRHTNATQLIQSQVGVFLPVDAVSYWVRGLPFPGYAAHTELNEQGYLHILEQNQWRITFQRYQPVATLALPTKILAEHPQQTVRIVIHEWTIPNS